MIEVTEWREERVLPPALTEMAASSGESLENESPFGFRSHTHTPYYIIIALVDVRCEDEENVK